MHHLKQGYKHYFSVSIGQLMGIITDILDSVATEPEWILVNDSFIKYLEFGMWDCLRNGISAHLAGTCPCTFPDLDKLMALLGKALGELILSY